MYKIAVCDDKNIVCAQVEKMILAHAKSNFIQLEVEVFYTGEELCEALADGISFDLIFLDIEFEDMKLYDLKEEKKSLPNKKRISGIEVGNRIRSDIRNESTQIVYISTHKEYAMELFKNRPMDFLIKPIQQEDIERCITKMMGLVDKTGKTFKYRQGRDDFKIAIKDILYFKSLGRTISMVTVTGEEYFYSSLKTIYDELKCDKFFYSSRKCLVNYNYVIEFRYDSLTMSNKEELKIAQPRRKQVRLMQVQMESEGLKNGIK